MFFFCMFCPCVCLLLGALSGCANIICALSVQNAGTICFQKKWWESPTFPHAILRDIQSVRRGVLMHTKLLLVRRDSSMSEAAPGQAAVPRGWAYVGSANMSESAWCVMMPCGGEASKVPPLSSACWERKPC